MFLLKNLPSCIKGVTGMRKLCGISYIARYGRNRHPYSLNGKQNPAQAGKFFSSNRLVVGFNSIHKIQNEG